MTEITPEVLDRIKVLQIELNTLRKQHKISSPGYCLLQEDLAPGTNDSIVVVTDGLNGAICGLVHGSFPSDFALRHSRSFKDEESAKAFAKAFLADEDKDWEDFEKFWDVEYTNHN